MEVKDKIINEAKRIEEDSLYSSKGHFYAAQFWSNFHIWLGVPASVMAAISGASALSEFSNHGLLAGLLAISAAAITATSTFINPNEKSTIHLNAGNKYNSLKNRARIFCELEVNAEPQAKLLSTLKKLATERDELNNKSPQIPKWAFRKARKGIEEGESDYKVDQD